MKITFFIIFFVLFIYYINKLNINESVRNKLYLYLFNGLSFFFVSIFLYYSLSFGFNKGIFNTLLIWSLFVVATPIPEAGLLVSVPLKSIFKLNLDITQWFVSVFALSFLFYAYYNFRKRLNETKYGKILLNIIHFGFFGVFISSIIGSVSLAYLINAFVDNILDKKELNDSNNIIYFLFFVSFFYYFYLLAKIPNFRNLIYK